MGLAATQMGLVGPQIELGASKGAERAAVQREHEEQEVERYKKEKITKNKKQHKKGSEER